MGMDLTAVADAREYREMAKFAAEAKAAKQPATESGATNASKDKYVAPAQPASQPAQQAPAPKGESVIKRVFNGFKSFFSSNGQTSAPKAVVVQSAKPQVGECVEARTPGGGVRCY